MDKGKLSAGADLLRVSTIGINFVLCTFAGIALGWGAKKLFHLEDWAILVGFLFGVVSSYVFLIESLRSLNRDQKRPPAP